MVAGKSLSQMFRIQWHQINALVIPPTINSKLVAENKGKVVADLDGSFVKDFPEVFNET